MWATSRLLRWSQRLKYSSKTWWWKLWTPSGSLTLDSIMNANTFNWTNYRSEVNVLVISSSRDAHGTTIYPTHPYSLRSNYKNLRFLPDPCTVQINGVTVGISSTDIFSHILDAELSEFVSNHFFWKIFRSNRGLSMSSSRNAGDKIKRVANYLFHQSSFYPMSPASNQVSLDVGLAQKYASLDVVPNILIISSALKPFVRVRN